MIVIAPDGLASGGLSTELVAAFIGAILGGAISLGTTWYFSRDAEKKKNRGLGLRVLHKVQQIASTVQHAHAYVSEAKARAGSDRLSGQLIPIVGFRTEPIDFDAEELSIFTLTGHADVTQNLLNTASFHNLMVAAIAEYCARRNAHDEEMSRVGMSFDLDDGTRQTTVDEPTMRRLLPAMKKLEDLAQHLLRLTTEGLPFVLEVASSTPKKLRMALREPRFPVELVYGTPNDEAVNQ
jgi:hypothetical protein